jgi:hypothetical protein
MNSTNNISLGSWVHHRDHGRCRLVSYYFCGRTNDTIYVLYDEQACEWLVRKQDWNIEIW